MATTPVKHQFAQFSEYGESKQHVKFESHALSGLLVMARDEGENCDAVATTQFKATISYVNLPALPQTLRLS